MDLRHPKTILIVVLCGELTDPYIGSKRLGWLESHISSLHHTTWICYGKDYLQRNRLHNWKYYDRFCFDELYQTLQNFNSVDFALHLSIGEDNKGGFGAVKHHLPGERLVLRSLILLANGNVIFGDWGFPVDIRENPTDEQIRARCWMTYYQYQDFVDQHYTEYEQEHAIFYNFRYLIPHYFSHPYRAWSIGHACLPLPVLQDIHLAIMGKKFSWRERLFVCFVAYFKMYFADDGLWSVLEWKHAPHLQRALIKCWVRARFWFGSSTWREFAADATLFYAYGPLYASFWCLFFSLHYVLYGSPRLTLQRLCTILFFIGPSVFLIWYSVHAGRHPGPAVFRRITFAKRHTEYSVLCQRFLIVHVTLASMYLVVVCIAIWVYNMLLFY